jgi:sigma-B regulation protein RsbU (phosphoserine phosphatase)
MRVLIVEDTRVNAELLDRLLRAEGFATLRADNAELGRKLAEEDKPDIILMDVMMPGESGFEACAKLKSNPATADIPVIFLSALDDVESKVQGFRLGGVDYIPKPPHGDEVLARVRVHLRIREANRELARTYQASLAEFRDAQRAMLVRPEDLPQANFAVCFEPLEAAGGDFYDVHAAAPNVFGYFVADVSGHGASAAFLTSAVKALLRQHSGPLFTPEESLRAVGGILREILGEEQYVTACYAVLNHSTGRLSLVSAGHPPALLMRQGEPVEFVAINSDPLGIFQTAVLQRRDFKLKPGDRFLLYSDGVIEAQSGGRRSDGQEILAAAAERYRTGNLDADLKALRREVLPSVGADDVVLLLAEVKS